MSRPDSSQRRETHKPFPHSPEAERGLIACALYHPDTTLERATRSISAETFHDPRHGPMWACIVAMWQDGKPINPETFLIELRHQDLLTKAGGDAYASTVTGTFASPAEIAYFLKVLRETKICRAGIELCTDLRPRFFCKPAEAGEVVEELEKGLLSLIQASRGATQEETIIELSARSYAALTEENPEIGIATGFPELDEKTWGMERKELIVVAGANSDGKSAFAQALINHACVENGHRSLVFTREMEALEYQHRLVQIRSRVNVRKFRNSTDRSVAERTRIRNANNKIASSPLHIVDHLTHIMQLRAEARAIHARHGKLRLIVIDYDAKFRGLREKGDTKTDELASISWNAKEMAMETGATVVLLSQVTKREDGTRALKGNSGKDEDGNKVWMIETEEDSTDRIIRIRKNRDGERGGTVRLGFEGYCTRFFTPQ